MQSGVDRSKKANKNSSVTTIIHFF